MSEIVERILNGESVRTVCSEAALLKEDVSEATNDKYILFTQNGEQVFDDWESAEKAYKECPAKEKFLYAPDKDYFLCTLSSVGWRIGHDHGYHRDIAKCRALFRAKNKNQIANFLKRAEWKQGRSQAETTIARIDNGPRGGVYNSRADWEQFKNALHRNYLWDHNISYTAALADSYGAVDVDTFQLSNGFSNCPYRFS